MLGREDRIGTAALGKHADLVLLRADALNLLPIHDPISTVVIQSNPSNIDSVMIGGRWRKRHGRLRRKILDHLLKSLASPAKGSARMSVYSLRTSHRRTLQINGSHAETAEFAGGLDKIRSILGPSAASMVRRCFWLRPAPRWNRAPREHLSC